MSIIIGGGTHDDDNVSCMWDFLDTVVRAVRILRDFNINMYSGEKVLASALKHYIYGNITEYDIIVRHSSILTWNIDRTLGEKLLFVVFRPPNWLDITSVITGVLDC